MNWTIDNNLGSITDIMFHDILKAFKDKGKYTGSLDVVPLSNACMKIIKIGDAFLASLFFSNRRVCCFCIQWCQQPSLYFLVSKVIIYYKKIFDYIL